MDADRTGTTLEWVEAAVDDTGPSISRWAGELWLRHCQQDLRFNFGRPITAMSLSFIHPPDWREGKRKYTHYWWQFTDVNDLTPLPPEVQTIDAAKAYCENLFHLTRNSTQ